MKKTDLSSSVQNKRPVSKIIGFISRSAHVYLHHKFKDFSIGHAQGITLHFICRHNGISQNEVVQHLKMNKSSVTSQLNYLEKNGYIFREVDPEDSRGKLLFISPKTEAIKAQLFQIFDNWSEQLLQGFDAEEKEAVEKLLDKMALNAKNTICELKD